MTTAGHASSEGAASRLMPRRSAGLALLGFSWLILLGSGEAASAQAVPVRPGDEVFVISTRCLPSCPVADVPARAQVWRLDGQGSPAVAPATELLTGGQGRRTILYVHGNRVEYQDAVNYARQIYQTLLEQPSAPPFRLVVWSWPADELRGPLRDVKTKAARAGVEATFLAQMLPHIDRGQGLSIISFSFGSRIVVEALAASPRPAQVAFLSAAIDRNRVCTTGCQARAIGPGVNVLNLFNSQDSALRHYHLIDQSHSGALGYEGWPCCATCGGSVSQLDAAGYVGRTHSLKYYLASPAMRSVLRQHLLPPML